MNPGVLFSSKPDLWETPQYVFDLLDQEFHFETDVCAIPENAKCRNYYTPEMDGLKQTWKGVCWCNPPYGRKVGDWVKKAFESAKEGATVVMLLPARTDTAWSHDYIYDQADVRFVRGRLKFGGSKTNAPFPSMVVVFRGGRRMDKMKPCPFCGGNVEEMGGSCNYGKRIMTLSIVCRGCGTKYQFKAKFENTPYKEAVEAWNRRAENG